MRETTMIQSETPREPASEIVGRARRFAIRAHESIDQRRKYSGEPYSVHPQAVAAMVASVTDDPETIAAAWLHDVVEDTPVTFDEIEKNFGTRIMNLVRQVTNVSRPEDGNRAARKQLDRDHLARASSPAQTIKLADLIHNCSDICSKDPGFAPVYLREMGKSIEVLTAGDRRLLERARQLYARTLGSLVGLT